jgi:hypothetical protein
LPYSAKERLDIAVENQHITVEVIVTMGAIQSIVQYKIPDLYWQWGILIFLILLMTTYGGFSFWFYQKYSMFTETPTSIATLLSVRRNALGSIPAASFVSVTGGQPPWSLMNEANKALYNWRPLTVRLVGYLGGSNGLENGVFDMNFGVTSALKLGARCFLFDIDYLEVAPCRPLLLYRDKTGYKRSLNSGSILEGMTSLSNNAFTNNTDPILIILYLHRVPPGNKQKERFFLNLAQSLKPLATNRLGSLNGNNYFSCGKEDTLFSSPITTYRQKFIVCVNYDTSQLGAPTNPTDNLHYWNNARIYQDPQGIDATLGLVTPSVANGGSRYIKVASTDQIINTAVSERAGYATGCSSVFTISLAPPEYEYTNAKMETLLNILGVQCVPLDVLSLGTNPNHASANAEILRNKPITTPGFTRIDLSTDNSISKKDPLSYWYYAPWSFKNIAIYVE